MRVALDDFGTGFASLTHLLTVPVDIIKIDKSFVERLVPGHGAVIIVEGLLSIAAKLGLRVVAEGIETDAQLDQLLSFGCRLGQGYLFSKAVDQDAATSLLARYGQHAEIGRSRAARLSVYRAKRSYLSAIRRKPCSDTMLDVLRAQASRWSMSARDLHVWIPLGPAYKALPVWMVCIHLMQRNALPELDPLRPNDTAFDYTIEYASAHIRSTVFDLDHGIELLVTKCAGVDSGYIFRRRGIDFHEVDFAI